MLYTTKYQLLSIIIGSNITNLESVSIPSVSWWVNKLDMYMHTCMTKTLKLIIVYAGLRKIITYLSIPNELANPNKLVNFKV